MNNLMLLMLMAIGLIVIFSFIAILYVAYKVHLFVDKGIDITFNHQSMLEEVDFDR